MYVREVLAACADTCQYQCFSMAYTPWGSNPTEAGSRYDLISVADFSARLQESSIRDRQTDLLSLLTPFKLWQGFWYKTTLLSINQIEAGDIQRG